MGNCNCNFRTPKDNDEISFKDEQTSKAKAGAVVVQETPERKERDDAPRISDDNDCNPFDNTADVDQVVAVDAVEEKNPNDDSLFVECAPHTEVELTKKTKTETFKVEHPLKNHGVEKFKQGFKNKLGKELIGQ